MEPPSHAPTINQYLMSRCNTNYQSLMENGLVYHNLLDPNL